jgi:hypothetical protein
MEEDLLALDLGVDSVYLENLLIVAPLRAALAEKSSVLVILSDLLL